MKTTKASTQQKKAVEVIVKFTGNAISVDINGKLKSITELMGKDAHVVPTELLFLE